jgi:predicted N-acetyltransferase YhbS
MIDSARVKVRSAKSTDAEALSALIAHLGFVAKPDLVRANLAVLSGLEFRPLVAEADELIGCISLNVMHVLHRPSPVGRLSMLVVAPSWRGQGVGRCLVEKSLEVLRRAGCGLCEVTSNKALVDAHAFYERLGFEQTSVRLARHL